jgi:predicted permease
MTAWSRLTQMAARLRAFLRPSAIDLDFDEELASHLAMLTDDNIRRGMSPDDARRAARLRLGAAASLKEQHREARGLPGLDAVIQDVRFAFRLIARDRWFSAAAIAALALGIGANATGFTIMNAVFLRGLPFENADRLYVLSWQNRSGRRSNISHPEFQNLRAQTRRFADLAAYRDASMNISDDRALPDEAHGTWVTANTFGVLHQPPLIGRDFTPGDERPGADPVVIIGYTLWRDRYAFDPNALGRTLRVNGQAATIVGVMPEGMRFPDDSALWAPYIPQDAEQERVLRPLRVFGRLQDGTDRRSASAEMSAIAQQLIAVEPQITKDLTGIRVETFTERYIGGGGRPMFLTVMGAVVFVLLIACANVANLLLSRSASRAREVAVRTALGASRWRVIRQLLIESLVLGAIGGALGVLLAVAGARAFDEAIRLSGLPYWVVFTIDYVVLGYVVGICVLSAVLCGLAPALHVSKTKTFTALKDGGRGIAGSRYGRRFSSAIVVAELALTMVLLVGAASMVRSFMTLYFVDLGIRIDRLVTMRLQMPEAKYRTAEARRGLFDRLEPRLAAIPGVEAICVTTGVPPLDGGERLLEIDGLARRDQPTFVGTVAITPRFFDVVGVRIARGRSFNETDGAPGAETVIINERLAAQFFAGEDPLGRRLRFTRREASPGTSVEVWRTIVGVSPTIRQGSPTDEYLNAVVYIPIRQESPAAASLLVRSALPPGSVMDAVRREVQAIDPDQPVLGVQTVAQVLAQDRWWYRTWGGLFGILSGIALLLSCVGLYAVMAYSVTERTQEIGVRLALGARRRQVSWLILRRGLAQLMTGLAIGFLGSLALSRILPGGLASMTPHDPIALLAVALLLSGVSIVACLAPARRATRVDPVVALRAD